MRTGSVPDPVFIAAWQGPQRGKSGANRITAFDTSCFSGEYVTGDVTREFLARIEHERSDGVRAQRLLDLPGGRTVRAI